MRNCSKRLTATFGSITDDGGPDTLGQGLEVGRSGRWGVSRQHSCCKGGGIKLPPGVKVGGEQVDKFFRVDKRDFYIGDAVLPAGEFWDKAPAGTQEVEAIFESRRPAHLPQRVGALYVFEALEDAKKYWSKMKDGKLYEVEAELSDVLLRADMALVDCAHAHLGCADQIAGKADRYWAEVRGENATIEVLVNRAKVCRIISKDDKERYEYLRSRLLVQSCQPTSSTLFFVDNE